MVIQHIHHSYIYSSITEDMIARNSTAKVKMWDRAPRFFIARH